jgi:hypothetical protein
MSELATESLVAQKIATGDYKYTITLKDTGTTTIGTFWFSWIASPFEDFMPVKPLSVALPAGWTDNITNTGSTDGYAIEWFASSSSKDLQPGQSKVFHFHSSATPKEIFGKSKFYPTELVTTSFVYEGMPFSDAGYEFHSSSNKVIPPPPAPGASTTELLGLNDHGIADLGNTHGLLAVPAGDEAFSGLAGILASSTHAMPSAETFSASIGGMSRSGPAIDLGTASAVHNEGWGWHGSS